PTEGTLTVLGYYGSESFFFTNVVSLGSIATSYGVISCSAALPSNAIAGFFKIGSGDSGAFLRQNGSTDNYPFGAANTTGHYVIGCDSSQNISAIAGGAGRTLGCIGCMTAGF